ncbi:hypothetical protein C8R46DRAFT_142327 [Mycena filopes]|nr:hypothetical protein C8R46DRAFT_142327 [Mycena filopes]
MSSTTITERLPPEIIMEIFTVCCSERYPIHASLPAQLSHVCSAWRALTLSMPVLWANFTVMITEVVKPGLGALLDMHLERSGQSPLSFNVDFNSMGDEIPAAVLGLLAPLVDHSDRWKRVKLPFWPGFAPLFTRLTGRLGRLEALDLRIRGIPLDTNEGLDSAFFAVAPRLRRLALGASLPRKIPFPSNQLTELHLGAAPTMELGQFLTSALARTLPS